MAKDLRKIIDLKADECSWLGMLANWVACGHIEDAIRLSKDKRLPVRARKIGKLILDGDFSGDLGLMAERFLRSAESSRKFYQDNEGDV